MCLTTHHNRMNPTCYCEDLIYSTKIAPLPLPTLVHIIKQANDVAKRSVDYANYYATIAENALTMNAIECAIRVAHKAARRANIHAMIVASIVMDLVLSQPLDIYSSDSESEAE